MSNLLITGAQVINPRGPDEVTVATEDVYISGNYLARVGDRGHLPEGWEPSQIIEGRGQALIPGMVNCHTHAAMTLLRGYADDVALEEWLNQYIWPVEAELQAQDVYRGTRLAALEMMRAGITTFCDMYFFMDEVALAVEESGLRARLARGLVGVAPGAQEALEEALEWAHRWNGAAGGRITAELGPHAVYTCPHDFMTQVIERARQEGLGLHTHISETKDEVERCLDEHQKSPVRVYYELGAFDLPVIAAHLTHLVEGDIDILAREGVGVALNPVSNLKLAGGFPPAVELIEAGALLGLGTDGAASSGHVNLFSEMRMLSLPQKGLRGDASSLKASRCLYLATRGGALALGMERLGLIEPGYLADLCLVDLYRPHLSPVHDVLSALVYGALGSEIETVICDGQVIMKEGQPQLLDENRVLAEAAESAEALVDRARR